jgi:hypothetical protein
LSRKSRGPLPLRRMTVTPEQAAVWAATSKQARIRSEKVDRYRSAMNDGEWDPEQHRKFAVRFYEGRLINGNHRMHALAGADGPADMWVEGFLPGEDADGHG